MTFGLYDIFCQSPRVPYHPGALYLYLVVILPSPGHSCEDEDLQGPVMQQQTNQQQQHNRLCVYCTTLHGRRRCDYLYFCDRQ